VRLVQIDAPEVRPPECYGRAADRIVRELLPPGSAVRLEFDPDLDRVDRFGRSLAYVFEGEVNVNLDLVRRGAAAPYFFGGDRGRYADELLTAARRARAERRGLWAACPATRLNPERALASGP
jgi:micrococcal nuclease